MICVLYVYLGGVLLRAFLLHGAFRNSDAHVKVDEGVIGCLIWPLMLVSTLVAMFRNNDDEH